MSKDTSRLIAAELLAGVLLDGSYANLLLPRLLADSTLNQADRALATELSYGTLRMQGSIDQILERLSSRPLDELDPEVLIVLRLGSYQLLATRIPSHAAVDESVKLIRQMRKSSAAGFINAMLRKVSSQSFERWAEEFYAAETTDAALGFRYHHPEWIIRAFRESLSVNTDHTAEEVERDLIDLLQANNLAPQVNFAVLPVATQTDRSELADHTKALPYSSYARLLGSGLPGRFRSVQRGRVRVQDQGSQLAALALVAAKELKAGEHWADFCAGPGGKAALLGNIAVDAGISFLANEINPVRAKLVAQAMKTANPQTDLRVSDARDFSNGQEKFDRIMLDAPCSGIGALRRRPEARWQKTPRDLANLVTLQEELIEAAISSLAPGGILAYVTCSSHPAETIQVVNKALKNHPELIALDTPDILQSVSVSHIPATGQAAHSVTESFAQLWPHRHGTDAMFIALLTHR